jgi:hypothetical protein
MDDSELDIREIVPRVDNSAETDKLIETSWDLGLE